MWTPTIVCYVCNGWKQGWRGEGTALSQSQSQGQTIPCAWLLMGHQSLINVGKQPQNPAISCQNWFILMLQIAYKSCSYSKWVVSHYLPKLDCNPGGPQKMEQSIFQDFVLINSYLFSACWIEHLFLIIITPRSSNLVENFLFYE